MFVQLQEYTKKHWIAHFKWMSYTAYKLYLNKAVFEKMTYMEQSTLKPLVKHHVITN